MAETHIRAYQIIHGKNSKLSVKMHDKILETTITLLYKPEIRHSAIFHLTRVMS